MDRNPTDYSPTAPRPARLVPLEHDGGRLVPSDSEEYRHDCECRYVLDRMPDKYARNLWLYGNSKGVRDTLGRIDESMIGQDEPRRNIAKKRGLAAAERIREGAMAIATARRAKRAPTKSAPEIAPGAVHGP